MRPIIYSIVLILCGACSPRFARHQYLHVPVGQAANHRTDTLVFTRMNKKWNKPASQEYRLNDKRLFRLNYIYSDSGNYRVVKQNLIAPKWTDPNQYLFTKNGQLSGHTYLNRFGSDTLSYHFYHDGSISRSFYLNQYGVHGRELNYYPNGDLRVVRTFHYGKLISVDSILHPDGSLLPIGDFKDGNGTVKLYDCNGKEYGSRKYENGRKVKKKTDEIYN
jgi:antitoxin component YwqK of YwqJK toxin-antitoxin module